MWRKLYLLLFIGALFGGWTACSDQTERIEISSEKTEKSVLPTINEKLPPLRIAVGGMITPREGHGYYRELLDYLAVKLDREIQYVDREDYGEINALLQAGDLDAAFVCGGPYVDGHNAFGMELLAAPRAYGGSVYYSYIIVHKDNPAQSFEELRGSTFTFTDPLSNTGKLVPTYMLAKMDETPDSFFKSYQFSYAHDKSIKAVATHVVDGAAIDSLIWEYANQTNPVFTAQTKIIKKSPPYGIPPVVVRPNLSLKEKNLLRHAFLSLHSDDEGKRILEGMMTDRFVLINDSAYDSIRDMKTWIQTNVKSDKGAE